MFATDFGTPSLSSQPSPLAWSDDGLTHNHHWASRQATDPGLAERTAPLLVADATAFRTPSCALHDDAHYA